MAKGKKKLDSKAYAQQKRHRRKWLTFVRMCRYGINNFSRNDWLTVAATAVMTITLFVIFISLTSRNILIDTANQIRDKVSMSVYLKTDTPADQVNAISDGISNLSSVISVDIKSPDDARSQFVQDNKDDEAALDALKESTNLFPYTINGKVKDINNTTELQHFVDTNDLVK